MSFVEDFEKKLIDHCNKNKETELKLQEKIENLKSEIDAEKKSRLDALNEFDSGLAIEIGNTIKEKELLIDLYNAKLKEYIQEEISFEEYNDYYKSIMDQFDPILTEKYNQMVKGVEKLILQVKEISDIVNDANYTIDRLAVASKRDSRGLPRKRVYRTCSHAFDVIKGSEVIPFLKLYAEDSNVRMQ